MQHNERRKTSRHKNSDEINYNLEINIYFDNAFQKRNTKPKAYQDGKRRVKYNRNQDFEYKVSEFLTNMLTFYEISFC